MREAAKLVPADRLLTETDSPYMTPEPLRGTDCGPAHTIYTADVLCEVRGADTPEARAALLAQLYENAQRLLNRKPTPWQRKALNREAWLIPLNSSARRASASQMGRF